MREPIVIEVCVDSVESALAAQRGGASRIELCSDLLEGGVTPGAGLIEIVRARASLPLHLMIRPRGGDFCYTADEFEIMLRDIATAKKLGADGIVLGILNPAGKVDLRATSELVELAKPLSVTFHRAFDMSADLTLALEDICATGATRILTSGGEQTAEQGMGKIAELVKTARGRLEIIAGSGINHCNAAGIIEHTSVREIHVGVRSAIESPMQYRNPKISMGTAAGREYQRFQVLEENVSKLRQAVDSLRV